MYTGRIKHMCVARWLSCLHCLHCRLTARRLWVRFPHGALLAPQSAQCSSGLSPGPFCVEFACSPRVHKGLPPLRTTTEKHAKRTEHSCQSLTETDGSLGPRVLRSCPLLLEDPGGGAIRDGLKAEDEFTATSGLCVCVLCRLHIYITRVCCSESFVPLKSDNYTIISHVHVTHIMSYWS